MAEPIRTELVGAKEAQDALKSLTKKERITLYYKLNSKAGTVVKNKLKANAPSAQIKRNVVQRKMKGKATGVVVGFLKEVFYVRFLEFGTEIRTTKGKKYQKVKANRGQMSDRKKFVERSHDQAAVEVQERFGKNYQEELNKTLKSEIKRVNNRVKKLKGK